MELTKDADKLICAMYKAYLESRKAGTDKFRALHFTYSDIATYKPCINWSRADIRHTEDELVRNGFGKRYMDGSFFANDSFCILHLLRRLLGLLIGNSTKDSKQHPIYLTLVLFG